MKTSARNQFSGTVLAVKTGAVNSEISIGLPGGHSMNHDIDTLYRIVSGVVFTALRSATTLVPVKG